MPPVRVSGADFGFLLMHGMVSISDLAGAQKSVAFASARRHSFLVRMLKIAIPAGCGLLLLMSSVQWLMLVLAPAAVPTAGPAASASLADTRSGLTMENARLSGFTADSEAYTISARTARQDVSQPQLVALQDLRASINFHNRDSFALAAGSGMFDTKSESLILREGITITSTNGYEGQLQDAQVNVRLGSIRTENPVMLKMLSGSLRADRMDVTDRGQHLLFSGRVQLNTFMPNADAGVATGSVDPTLRKATP